MGLYVGGRGDTSPVMTKTSVITDRDAMRKAPPDVLLTNYKMLDYLLVRPRDRTLWEHNAPDTLRYVVVDELHTFDGAQGTDLALLLRRLRARLLYAGRAPDLHGHVSHARRRRHGAAARVRGADLREPVRACLGRHRGPRHGCPVPRRRTDQPPAAVARRLCGCARSRTLQIAGRCNRRLVSGVLRRRTGAG